MPYKPYSLRPNGATHAFQELRSYSAVAQIGRWNSKRTVHIYIADSLALLQDMNFLITPHQRHFLRQWAQIILTLKRRLHTRSSGGCG